MGFLFRKWAPLPSKVWNPWTRWSRSLFLWAHSWTYGDAPLACPAHVGAGTPSNMGRLPGRVSGLEGGLFLQGGCCPTVGPGSDSGFPDTHKPLGAARPQFLSETQLHLAGTKTTGNHHGRNTSTTSPRTSGPSWPPGWPLSSSSRCEGPVCFQKVWESRHRGGALCPEQGQEDRSWLASGARRLEDLPWAPKGGECW